MSELSTAPKERLTSIQKRLDEARLAGRWLMWAGWGLAMLWWGAAFGGAIALVGFVRLESFGTAAVIAGVITLILPGFLMIVASLFAREQVRSSASNALVIEAAAQLLQPLETTGEAATNFAQSMQQASSEVDKTMSHALTAMRAVSEELGDERHRLESVTYASADNARDLATRLSEERTTLEDLTRELQRQTETLNTAIPSQIKLMVESANQASQDVASAEDGLKARLASLDTTGQNLRTRIEALDHLASEAEKRNETLLFAISRMEEKLEQSRRTVETASRAGELAAAAATTTGDRLVDSVNAALDHARQASREIQEQSFQASETAAKALANLKRAGEEASVAVQSAAISLNSDEPDLHDDELFKEADTTDLVETEEVETQAPQIEETAELPQSPSRVRDDELFEVNADKMAAAMLEDIPNEADPEMSAEDDEIVETDVEVIDAVYEETETPQVNGSDQSNSIIEPPKRTPATNGSATLSDIIADMEREDSPTLSREETAERLIDRLTESGIKLNEIFKPRDKKRIALAARRGDSKRRVSTRQSAGRQVERVRGRLRSDSDLMALARDFIALEESDALNALENTRESRKHASPRLATYLLLDAALD
ncbi:MAG: hypothetical protein AAF296_10715 [Pseudomonadota bacterium]